MNIGDRFVKNGKLVEVTSVATWGYGYKEVIEDKPLKADVPVFGKTEPEPEEETPVVEKEVKKPVTRRKRTK